MSDRQELNRNLAQMLKGGVIMDVTTPEQAKIAEAAGACAVMALERIPADIRAAGGVSRMSDPAMIKGIQAAVSITAFTWHQNSTRQGFRAPPWATREGYRLGGDARRCALPMDGPPARDSIGRRAGRDLREMTGARLCATPFTSAKQMLPRLGPLGIPIFGSK